MEVFVVLSAILVLMLAAAAPGVKSFENPSMFPKVITNCLASNDTVACLSFEGITALNRAARSSKIEILPGVSIRRDAIISARGAKTVSEDEIIDSFPVEESRSSGRLFNLAISSWGNFIDSHSLEVKFSKESSKAFARALKDEHGKLKKKKKLPLLALALALKALLLAKYALWSHFCKKEGHKHAGIVKYVAPEGAAAAQQTDLPSGTGLAEQYPYNRAYENSQDLPYNAYAVYP